MGYANTTIVMYGVRLSSEDAKKIFDKFYDEDEYEYTDSLIEYSDEDVITDIDRHRYYPNLVSEKTDSRIHCLEYEEGYSHVFGLHIASNGYAYSDELENFMTINDMCTNNFNKYCKPVLDEFNINLEPKILITSQVW